MTEAMLCCSDAIWWDQAGFHTGRVCDAPPHSTHPSWDFLVLLTTLRFRFVQLVWYLMGLRLRYIKALCISAKRELCASEWETRGSKGFCPPSLILKAWQWRVVEEHLQQDKAVSVFIWAPDYSLGKRLTSPLRLGDWSTPLLWKVRKNVGLKTCNFLSFNVIFFKALRL